MPFAGYKDFAACVKANQDKSNPDAYCGRIQAAVEKIEKQERFDIAKVDEERQIVFGWANVVVRKDGGTVVDSQGDMIRPEVLEDAAYLYNLQFREANASQHFSPTVGQLVESFVSTPDKLERMGLAKDALPTGWWVGFHVDAPTFAKVKSGELGMFSIEGAAQRKAA